MQKMLGYMRKAIQKYNLIQEGDRVAVGVSGGKDSLVLLRGLHLLRRFIGIEYSLLCITLDPCFGGSPGDYSAVEALCNEMDIPFKLIDTQIGEIVFNVRKEKNPCSLCAKMRRGALHEAAKSEGCNKLALGHHFDDAVETFLMNLFIEGRIGCFSPKSYLDRRDITIIRPMVLAPEKEVRRALGKLDVEIVKSKCPADGHTRRQQMKEFIAQQNRTEPGFSDRIFGAMCRGNIDGWGGAEQTEILGKDLQ